MEWTRCSSWCIVSCTKPGDASWRVGQSGGGLDEAIHDSPVSVADGGADRLKPAHRK
jgi:hypothetical protein